MLLRDLLANAARAVGPIIREGYDRKVEVFTKSDHSPVTEIDLAVDAHLRAELTTARPGYGWLSEETADTDERLSRRFCFVVDPIDGTRSFIRRQPEFCTALAVVCEGVPVAAVVYNPITEELWQAAVGHGTYLNGTRQAISTRDQLSGARVLGSSDLFRHRSWPEPWPELSFTNKHALAYRLGHLSTGAYDAMAAFGPKQEWDICAGTLLVTEAGGRVTDCYGETLRFNRPVPVHPGIVAAGDGLHASFIARTQLLPFPSTLR